MAIFKRYARGRCQNASDRALRVNRSAVGRYWVYVCLPRGVGLDRLVCRSPQCVLGRRYQRKSCATSKELPGSETCKLPEES